MSITPLVRSYLGISTPVSSPYLYNNSDIIFEEISERIDKNLIETPSARFHICGDFSIRHKDWFVHPQKTVEEGRYCKDLPFSWKAITTANIICPKTGFTETGKSILHFVEWYPLAGKLKGRKQTDSYLPDRICAKFNATH